MRNAADSRGVFKAKIEKSLGKSGPSTFYPSHYRPEDVVMSFAEASRNRAKIGPNKYIGRDSQGIIVEIRESAEGRVQGFFPVHEADLADYDLSKIGT